MHRLRMIPARLAAERLIAEKFGMEAPTESNALVRSWAADYVEAINREIDDIDRPPEHMSFWRRLRAFLWR